MTYNYMLNVTNDVMDYIKENFSNEAIKIHWSSLDDFMDDLCDELWVEDSVTGNGSGSYTFNRCQAKEMVVDNIDLLGQMIGEFDIDSKTIADKFLAEDWEYFDVSIRCYLLNSAIYDACIELELDKLFEED